MSIYNSVSYREETYPAGTFWTEISSDAYGSQQYVPWLIAFNYSHATLTEEDRHSFAITQELTLKIPDLAEEFFDSSALPIWRQ
jgi:hypothetical protein